MIIALCGKARSGKNTVGDILINIFKEKYGTYFESISYARELKEKIKYDFDMTDDQVYGNLKEVSDERYLKGKVALSGTGGLTKVPVYWTPRQLLQYFGTDIYRNIDPNIWVRLLRKSLDKKGDYIITDARFPNEIDWVVDNGGVRLIVERDSRSEIGNVNHISETSLDTYSTNVDYYVDNNGTLEDLYKLLKDKIVPQILNKMNNKEISNG